MHSNWRDSAAWKDAGLPMSTASNEACKLFDATLSQYMGWYDEKSLGGLENTVVKMFQADENFVMGKVIANGLDLIGTGTSIRIDKELKQRVDDMVDMADKDFVLDREKKHVFALKEWADGHMSKATDLWEDILVDYPCDLLALKFCHDTYFYLGYQAPLRDSIARVLPHWNESLPHFGHLMGMYSFGLVETNLFNQAEIVAKKGLVINKNDAWSTHSLAHVYEMGGRFKEGRAFMKSTEADWSPMGMLACHLYWHWGLYDIEQGNYDDAIHLFDQEVGQRVKSGALLDIVDACSLLFRLELEGVDVKDRWQGVYDICKAHQEDHILLFNDVHILMSCLGSKHDEAATHLMASMKKFAKECVGDNAAISREVGIALCESLVAYANDDFEKAVDLIVPIRYKIIHIGGSEAQRDIFKLYLIIAAMKSKRKEHRRLSRQLLYERKAFKDNSPMTDCLLAKAMMLHCD